MKFLPLKFSPEKSSTTTICLTIDRQDEKIFEIFIEKFCQILFQIENQPRLILQFFLQLLQSFIFQNDESPVTIWTEKEKEKTIEEIFILDVLKRILEFFSENINVVLDHLDDTIRVTQVTDEREVVFC